jgi:hypothetical protein
MTIGGGELLGSFFLKKGFSPGAHENPLSNGKPEIVVVVLRHFSDNGRQGGGKSERLRHWCGE